MNYKISLVVILTVIIAAVHLLYTGSNPVFHVLHQQLFFIPLVLASFWFGRGKGLLTAAVISALYAPAMFLKVHAEGSSLVVFTQVSLYLFVALLMGWLSDEQRVQQERLLKNERINTLGKAASTLSFEVRDIVNGIDEIHKKSGGLKEESANDDFFHEINRLKRLLNALGQFGTLPAEQIALSNDLNDIMRYTHDQFLDEAARKKIRLVLAPDSSGCPSTVPPEPITRIFNSLVSNAIEFSKPGQAVILRSIRKGKTCNLEVADSGPGVAKENENKLFTPFFTTKPDGYGLSLSAGRKVLRDFGGDLAYERRPEGGANFIMTIPREHQEGSIEHFAAESLKA
ncbi:MAG: ATP-binding protein [Desulforhopalus sp.]